MNIPVETTTNEMAKILKHPETLDQQSLEYWARRSGDRLIAQQYQIERLKRELAQSELAKELLALTIKEMEEGRTIDTSTFTLESNG